MGRQKTLWIDEDCWAKLEQMDGESISGKVRTAIMSHEMDREAQVQALKRQIAHLEAYISDLEKRPKQRRTMQ